MNAARCAALWVLLATLPGCASAPATPPAAAAPAPPPVVSAPLAPSPASAPAGNGAGTGDESAPPHAADAPSAAPACSCVENKAGSSPPPQRRRRRRKHRPEHREAAPPQLATAPVVAETPPGVVVNAEVKTMSVAVMSILGKRVKGPQGEDLGRVVDVLADASGRVRIAIIDFGGFLGVGNHRIAVDWPLLRFSPDVQDPSLLLSLSPEKLRTAPEYKDNPRPQTLMEPTLAAPLAAPAAVPVATPVAAAAAAATAVKK